MLKAPSEFLAVFIVISVLLILALALFISVIIYRYQQKQNIYFKDMEALKTSHETALLQSQLEIQEQTFQHISREIHDNINQKLTLSKLYLTTSDFTDGLKAKQMTNESAKIIGEAIHELTDLSRSMSSEIVLNNGLLFALQHEQDQLQQSGLFEISFLTTGSPVFLNGKAELVIFRIIQEALNNIMKHAQASEIQVKLHYDGHFLFVQIADNGKGFNVNEKHKGTGLQNIKKRTTLLNGEMEIKSTQNSGTVVTIKIPLYENR